MDAGLVELEELDLFFLFSSAENDAEWGVFARLLLVLGEPAKIEFHLTFVFGFEVTEFEVDSDESSEAAVVKEQIEVEIVGVDGDAELARLKGKALPQLQ